MGILHEHLCIFFIISRSVLLRMRNFPEKICRENQNTHFVFSNFFFNRVVYVIMWKYFVERGKPQMAIWRMRIACWIPKATDLHSEYVISIVFPLQQLLHERASVRTFSVLCLICTCAKVAYCCTVFMYITSLYRLSREECARLRENVP